MSAMGMTLDPVTCPGLVRADQATLAAMQQDGSPLEEVVALDRALRFEAHYIYFRRIPDRPAMPVAYVFDWSERLSDSLQTSRHGDIQTLAEQLAHLHRGTWSACEVPLVYVFLPTQVDIYHVLQGPTASPNGLLANPWVTINLAAEVSEALESLKSFSVRRLDDGRLWEEHPDARSLGMGGTAFMTLSEELARCREVLTHKHSLPDTIVRKLLIIFVMIKYIEERKDRQGRGVFPNGLFSKFAPKAQSFVDLLRAGGLTVVAFLDHLSEKEQFNGDVFRLDSDERDVLGRIDLAPFAEFLDARNEGMQRTFWRRYAFNELPVELISHIYEQFLPRQPGVVYTPPFLVNFILDEVLPLSQSTPESFRLIDPACGSGVFLVGAFKRLVHRWWRDNNFRPRDVATLKKILREHIFGVDIEGEAIRITIFSLSIALCDFLEPRAIWGSLHFDSLQNTNLFEGDFFAFLTAHRETDSPGFDLVVGNPPFVSNLTKAAAAELTLQRKLDPEFSLPDKQAALLFLSSAIRISKPNGQVALIQPSGPLLYNTSSHEFRKWLLERVHVPQFIDLTHLSRFLFKRPRPRNAARKRSTTAPASGNPGDVGVVIAFVENRAPSGDPLLHVTVRRTVQAEQKLMFEIDHYDLHFVSRQEAISNPSIWKANFIGGGRIPRLLNRINQSRRLGEFLEAATKRGWVKGEGYIAGAETKADRIEQLTVKETAGSLTPGEATQLRELRKRYKPAPWLTGRDMLPTNAFKADSGINWRRQTRITERYFAERRSERLFSPGPLLLIKPVIEAESGAIPVALLNSKTGVRFKDRIFGIRAPESDWPELEKIEALINNERLVHFHILATSPEFLVSRATSLGTSDILNLPYPESTKDLELSPLDEALIDDALQYVAASKRHGATAPSQQQPSSQELRLFGDFFCRVLGSVFPTVKAAAPVHTSFGICYPFYFGDSPSERLDSADPNSLSIRNLLELEISPTLRCQRVLRLFRGNMLLLIKPPQLRYWLRSVAVRDADEIFVELQGQGH